MSAILPIGIRNMVADRRYVVATQLRAMASILSSSPIEGRPTIMAEPMKVVRKEPMVVTNKTACRLCAFSILVPGLQVLPKPANSII